MNYLSWQEKKIDNFDQKTINDLYDQGFVFTRKEKGILQQTMSVRIDLNKFSLNSENKRILKKLDLNFATKDLPVSEYDWNIGKMAKDFYDKRGGGFSANKIKELLTTDLNFNKLFIYPVGYCISYMDSEILHYSYPFHNDESKDNGMAMMLKAIIYAKENNLKYIYLGSFNKYKMQFEGLEVFDGEEWKTDLKEINSVIN